jgi:hypothetical protein
MREENLFYRLTSNDENAATELLCNLCKFDAYKELIFASLKIDNQLFGFYDIDTQYKIPQKTKRPDIVIENNNMKIFIENKVTKYRRLEQSQLTVYPEHLKNISKTEDKKVMLIFLIPRGYKYRDKIEKAKEKYSFIEIAYWDVLLEKIKSKNKQLKSEILSESTVFFEKILNSMPEITFGPEEIKAMTDINHLAAESAAIGKTLELFSNTIDQLKENLKFTKKQPIQEVSKYCLGYYFFDGNCFLGYAFGLAGNNATEKYVLSLAIHENIISEAKLKKLKEDAYHFDSEWYYFGLNENLLESEKKEEKILTFCEKTMKDIIKK